MITGCIALSYLYDLIKDYTDIKKRKKIVSYLKTMSESDRIRFFLIVPKLKDYFVLINLFFE
jgi:hypothetical protein